MTTPSEFAEHVEVGDTIEWRTETRDIGATTHTVVEVQEGQDELKILVEGERGGRYRLLIRQDGETDVFYLRPGGEEEHFGPLTEVTIYSPASQYRHSW
jgi:hypothetical protein